jgi:hypothetical protein
MVKYMAFVDLYEIEAEDQEDAEFRVRRLVEHLGKKYILHDVVLEEDGEANA